METSVIRNKTVMGEVRNGVVMRISRREALLHSSFLFPVLPNESLAMGLEIKNKRRVHRLALFFSPSAVNQ